MGIKRIKGMSALKRELTKDLKTLEKRTVEATHKTADFGRLVAFSKAPVAFGQLRDGIVDIKRERGAEIFSTAPYSAAVEVGSRPHWPPLQPILEWVRLRGMQGLEAGPGATGHPGNVAGQIRGLGDGTSTPVDAALIVANRIRAAIAKNGTKPTWFMKRTVPEVERLLDSFVKTLFRDDL